MVMLLKNAVRLKSGVEDGGISLITICWNFYSAFIYYVHNGSHTNASACTHPHSHSHMYNRSWLCFSIIFWYFSFILCSIWFSHLTCYYPTTEVSSVADKASYFSIKPLLNSRWAKRICSKRKKIRCIVNVTDRKNEKKKQRINKILIKEWKKEEIRENHCKKKGKK